MPFKMHLLVWTKSQKIFTSNHTEISIHLKLFTTFPTSCLPLLPHLHHAQKETKSSRTTVVYTRPDPLLEPLFIWTTNLHVTCVWKKKSACVARERETERERERESIVCLSGVRGGNSFTQNLLSLISSHFSWHAFHSAFMRPAGSWRSSGSPGHRRASVLHHSGNMEAENRPLIPPMELQTQSCPSAVPRVWHRSLFLTHMLARKT